MIPSPDKYKTVNLERFKVRKNSFGLDKSETHRCDKIQTIVTPSYGEIEKAYSYAYETKLSPTPGKARKISFAEEAAIRKAKIPAVG